MEYIRVTKENMDRERVCCALLDGKDGRERSNKEWLANRFDDGLVLLKSVQREKSLIEYIPAENAWNPIEADGYMFIGCLWASGVIKARSYSNDLLDACIADSKRCGKKGLCVLSCAKKKPFLVDPKFIEHKGFTVADEADNGVQLWCLPFSKYAEKPRFKACAKHPSVEEKGYVLYYTSQCPFNANYVSAVERMAKVHDIAFKAIRLDSKVDAQNAPTPVTTHALFYDGQYQTSGRVNERKIYKACWVSG